jgi:hypothetical protein
MLNSESGIGMKKRKSDNAFSKIRTQRARLPDNHLQLIDE